MECECTDAYDASVTQTYAFPSLNHQIITRATHTQQRDTEHTKKWNVNVLAAHQLHNISASEVLMLPMPYGDRVVVQKNWWRNRNTRRAFRFDVSYRKCVRKFNQKFYGWKSFCVFLHRLLGRRLFQRTFIHDMNVFCMEMGNQSSTFRSEDTHKKWNEATTRWYICFATHLHRRVVIHLTISPWTSFVRSFVFYSTSNFKIINRILSAAHSHAHYTATYVTLRTMYLYIIIFDSVTIDRRAKRQRKPPRNQQKEENHIYIWVFVCRLDP